jgi:hypothetical protein
MWFIIIFGLLLFLVLCALQPVQKNPLHMRANVVHSSNSVPVRSNSVRTTYLDEYVTVIREARFVNCWFWLWYLDHYAVDRGPICQSRYDMK